MASEIELTKDQDKFTPKQEAVLRENLGVDKATPAELAMFFDQCQRTGLSPWARQIYMIGRWDYNANRNKYQVQVSIDGARLVAERTGEYEGQTAPQWCGTDGIWRDVWLAPTPPSAARVGVWRKGFREPAYGVARFTSYAQTNKKGKLTMTWAKMPDVMLAKCFTGDTQILTEKGFVRFDKLNGSELKIAQVADTGLELVDAEYIEQDYAGEMVTINADMLNFKVTPNHDMVTTYGKVEAGAMYQTTTIRGPWSIPMTVADSKPDNPDWSDDDLKLAGYVAADGNFTHNLIRVAVSREYKRDELEKLNPVKKSILHHKGNVAETSVRNIRSNFDKTLYTYKADRVLKLIDRDKSVNQSELMSLSARQAKIFVDAWLLFDGYENKKTGVKRVYTSNPDHVGAIELAAVKAGYTVNLPRERMNDISDKPGFSITVSKQQLIKAKLPSGRNPGLVIEDNPHGKVYCVRVPSGKVVVRRNGFSMVCGNCAESLALRKAFPMELSGLYTSEEMQQMDNPESVEAETPASETEQEYVEAEIIDDRDWLKEINEAGSVEQLRAIWSEASSAGAFQSQPALADIFTTKADELKAAA